MRTLTFLVLLSLSSIGAYGELSDAMSDSGPVGALALGTFSGGPARAATRDDDQLTANLATYVFLHKAWENGLPVPTAARLSVCPQ
jgi:hypothetical protein